jgi:hypothetical protein
MPKERYRIIEIYYLEKFTVSSPEKPCSTSSSPSPPPSLFLPYDCQSDTKTTAPHLEPEYESNDIHLDLADVDIPPKDSLTVDAVLTKAWANLPKKACCQQHRALPGVSGTYGGTKINGTPSLMTAWCRNSEAAAAQSFLGASEASHIKTGKRTLISHFFQTPTPPSGLTTPAGGTGNSLVTATDDAVFNGEWESSSESEPSLDREDGVDLGGMERLSIEEQEYGHAEGSNVRSPSLSASLGTTRETNSLDDTPLHPNSTTGDGCLLQLLPVWLLPRRLC